MSWILPVGLDSADGVTLLPSQPSGSGDTPVIVGTGLPTGDYQIWSNSAGGDVPTVEEMPGSPRWERAEQSTCEHRLKMSKADAIYYAEMMPRGTIVNDSLGNIWRILSCEYERDSDLFSSLHYVMESLSFDSPPDDFSDHPVSLDINIIKHPRYWWALSPYAGEEANIPVGDTAFASISIVKEAIIRMIQNYIESPFYPTQNQTNSLIQVNIINAMKSGSFQLPYPNPTFDASRKIDDPVNWSGNAADIPKLGNPNCAYYLLPSAGIYEADDFETGPIHIAVAAAYELISKLWRQEDTPYQVGRQTTWTQYFFAPVYLNPGGYIEDPRDWVPSYFMDVEQPFPPVNTLLPRADQSAVGQSADPSLSGTDPGANADAVPALGADTGGSIYDWMLLYNPQSYSDDGTVDGNLQLSCLRESDDVDYERTWFKVTHTWKVAPVGKWDSDLYKLLGEPGPQVASDFNQNPIDRSGI